MQNTNVEVLEYDDICRQQEIGKIIRQQVGISNLMACGAREWSFLKYGFNGLNFRVNASAKREFITVYLESNDTYTVVHYKLKRVTNERIQLDACSDVYCDMLGEIIYKMVNK